MKRKKGIDLESAMLLLDKKQKQLVLPYISTTALDRLEEEKGYESIVVSNRKNVKQELEHLYETADGETITYLNFYETNISEIKGYRNDVIVYKIGEQIYKNQVKKKVLWFSN